MFLQKFFKLFPPPKFLDIPYAGLDISDDAVRCIEYSHTIHGLYIRHYGVKALAPGIVEGGEIKDEKVLTETIAALAKELHIYAVKASLPEEKMYLFKTSVPSTDEKEIRQNIEFKLEENVPISPAESIFFFDLIPAGAEINSQEEGNTVSVSVAPQGLINAYLNAINAAGVTVLSFEVSAKAIARALVAPGSNETQLIVHIMQRKTGLYLVCGGVVAFTSTVPWSIAPGMDSKTAITELRKHMEQVFNYWAEHGKGGKIKKIILVGHDGLMDGLAAGCSPDPDIKVEIGKVWQNAFSHDKYIPPISYEDSLDYVVAAGLAFPQLVTNSSSQVFIQ